MSPQFLQAYVLALKNTKIELNFDQNLQMSHHFVVPLTLKCILKLQQEKQAGTKICTLSPKVGKFFENSFKTMKFLEIPY